MEEDCSSILLRMISFNDETLRVYIDQAVVSNTLKNYTETPASSTHLPN